MSANIDLKTLGPQLRSAVKSASRYSGMAFFILLAALYGFILFRINTLTSTQPDQAKVDAQVVAARIPRINPKVTEQLQSLEDNSPSVKALFNSNRQNPFQE